MRQFLEWGGYRLDDPATWGNSSDAADGDQVLAMDSGPKGRPLMLSDLPPALPVAVMFLHWVFGTGAAFRVFGPESPTTAMMMDAPGVQAARTAYLNKNFGLDDLHVQPLTNYAAGFGLHGLLAAGLDPVDSLLAVIEWTFSQAVTASWTSI
jgi:hypothetical protein